MTLDEILDYKRCKRRWWANHYAKIDVPVAERPAETALDERIVAALEEKYLDGRNLSEAYDQLTTAECEQLWATGQDTTRFEQLAERGSQVVAGYENWLLETNADDGIEAEYVHGSATADLIPGVASFEVEVPPIIHRKRDGKNLYFVHRPVSTLSELSLVVNLCETTRVLGAVNGRGSFPQVDGILYNALSKAPRTLRPPFYERVEVQFVPAAADSFWRTLQGAARDLTATRMDLDAGTSPLIAAWPTPLNECATRCSFYSSCYAVDDGSISDLHAV